jgi:hypothetical protein
MPKNIRSGEEEESIQCNYLNCAHGMGQAGLGRCPGDWNDPNCKDFINCEDFLGEQRIMNHARSSQRRKAHRLHETVHTLRD